MNCANHSDTAAAAFCRTCGKPLCANCTRDVRGVIYCEGCLAARMEGSAPTAPYAPPQTPYQQIMDQGLGLKVPPGPSSGPNPAIAGILAGFFPFGVGAVYCAQYAKGLGHLLIFGLLFFGANNAHQYDWVFIFSLAFFYIYQIIDAVRTAHAIQAGQPVPDPMGISQAFGAGHRFEPSKVPVGAVVLIGLGVLFLLHTMGFMEYGFERYWPLIIVFLGAWMFYRHWERSNQGCPCGRCHTRWLMGPVVVFTTGILLLLASMDVADIGRTWPAWLLVIGVVKLIQSSASSDGHVGPLPPGPATVAPVPPAVPVSPTETSSGEVRNV